MKTNAHGRAHKIVQRPQEGEAKSKNFAGTTKVVKFLKLFAPKVHLKRKEAEIRLAIEGQRLVDK